MNNKPLDDTDMYTILAEKKRILGDIEYIGYIAHKLVDTEERLRESMSDFLEVIERKYEHEKEDI
jgi:hypothetical protein